MKLIVSSSRISGQVSAPPSKSHTHRAFLLAALAKGESVVLSPLLGEDTLATLDAVKALGAKVCRSDDRITIMGGDLHAPLPQGTFINCKNSGTSIRMLAGIASRLDGTTGFTGDSSLCSRPMKPLLDALSELGAEVTSENGCAPFTITGPASGGEVHIRGDVSSQFISALLISAPLGKTDTNIHLTTSLTSKPYVNMTISAMKKHGVSVETTDDGYLVRSGQVFSPVDVQVGGDYSSAAFLFAAAALTGEITVSGLDPADPQGDQVVISILETFGAVVIRDGEKVTVRKADLTSADIDLANAPDLFPIIAVLAVAGKRHQQIIRSGPSQIQGKRPDHVHRPFPQVYGCRYPRNRRRMYYYGTRRPFRGKCYYLWRPPYNDGCSDCRTYRRWSDHHRRCRLLCSFLPGFCQRYAETRCRYEGRMNRIGEAITLTLFGASHDSRIGCVIDGIPAGFSVNEDLITADLALRKPSEGIGTPRVETDIPEISGVVNGTTTGSPVVITLFKQQYPEFGL